MKQVKRIDNGIKNFSGLLKKNLIFLTILIILTILVYFNSLFNGFAYDDELTIINNRLIRDWNNLSMLFSKGYFNHSGEQTYRPIVTLSYFFDYSLWGLKPFGYHLTNIILHSVNTALVYLFILSLVSDKTIAFYSALLFSIHPVQSEAVNAVSFREDLLVVFFLLPSFLLFLRIFNLADIDKTKTWILYTISLISFLLALLSKEMAVTFPLLLILYYLCFRWKENKGMPFLYLLTGYIAVTLLYLFFLYFGAFRNPNPEVFSYPDITARLLTLPVVLVKYFLLIPFPYELNADYIVKFSMSFTESTFLISFFLLTGLIMAALFATQKYAKDMFGLWWYFASLLPVMNVFPIYHIMAERYLYLPIIGVSLFFSVGLIYLYNLIPQLWRRGLIIIIAGITLIIGGRTIFRNMDWRDDIALWSKVINVSPDSVRGHYNLGNAYTKIGQTGEAIKEFRKTLYLNPDHPKAHNNLGIVYRKLGRLQEAVEEYKSALRLKPDDPDTHYNLGIAYMELGHFQYAIEEHKSALKFKPEEPDIHYNLGIAYTELGRLQEAVEEYKSALQFKSDDPDIHLNIGVLYARLGFYKEAEIEWNIVLSIAPNNRQAKENLKILKAKMG